MNYPLFHALKRDFQYFTCIRNGKKRRGMCHCFPMELDRKFFSGGSVAPNEKSSQLLRAIGRKKCFLNIPNLHYRLSPIKYTTNPLMTAIKLSPNLQTKTQYNLNG